MVEEMLSAPDESFMKHILNAILIWEKLKDRVIPTLARLSVKDPQYLEHLVTMMVLCHDIGKLTSPWQRRIKQENIKRPPHASLGATYLWKLLKDEGDIRHAPVFAVNIHHIDKGIIGENTERPHVQLIQAKLVYYNGKIKWANGAQEILSHIGDNVGITMPNLSSLTISDCEHMAESMRVWSRGVGLLERHKRRILASGFHQILKICDFRAAMKRGELCGKEYSRLITKFVEGGLL